MRTLESAGRGANLSHGSDSGSRLHRCDLGSERLSALDDDGLRRKSAAIRLRLERERKEKGRALASPTLSDPAKLGLKLVLTVQSAARPHGARKVRGHRHRVVDAADAAATERIGRGNAGRIELDVREF